MFSALSSGEANREIPVSKRDCQGLLFVKKLCNTGILEACF